jgi:hypothetical protein
VLELGAIRYLPSADSLRSLTDTASLSADTPGRQVESFHHGDALVVDLASALMLESLMSAPALVVSADEANAPYFAEDAANTASSSSSSSSSSGMLSPRDGKSKTRLKKSFHRKISPRVRA